VALKSGETNLVFTLLLVNSQKCSKCLSAATHILIGKENEFNGFFCQVHGEEVHKALETKYNFEQENRWEVKKKPRIKRYRLEKKKK